MFPVDLSGHSSVTSPRNLSVIVVVENLTVDSIAIATAGSTAQVVFMFVMKSKMYYLRLPETIVQNKATSLSVSDIDIFTK